MNVGIGTEASQFLFLGIHKLDFRYSALRLVLLDNYTKILENEINS